MNTLEGTELLESIRMDIASANLETAFNRLNAAIKGNWELCNDLAQISFAFRTHKNDFILGTLSESEKNIALAKIGVRLLSFINELKINSVSLLPEEPQEIQAAFNLLVISHNQESLDKFKSEFIAPLAYPNVTYRVANSFESVDGFHLIIFDNRYLGSLPNLTNHTLTDEQMQYIDHIKDYFKNSPVNFIHLGEEFYLIKSYRAKAHAANSLFALHARIREMQQFVRDYRIQS